MPRVALGPAPRAGVGHDARTGGVVDLPAPAALDGSVRTLRGRVDALRRHHPTRAPTSIRTTARREAPLAVRSWVGAVEAGRAWGVRPAPRLLRHRTPIHNPRLLGRDTPRPRAHAPRSEPRGHASGSWSPRFRRPQSPVSTVAMPCPCSSVSSTRNVRRSARSAAITIEPCWGGASAGGSMRSKPERGRASR